MLPTPDTSHVSYDRVYEPAEDSFLLLDTLSSATETTFLRSRFPPPPSSPPALVVEVGTGSGVVLAFATAHALAIFGTRHVLTAGVDVSSFACRATVATVGKAAGASASSPGSRGVFLGSFTGDLATPWRDGAVDVLVFNPPYVPTPEMPVRPASFGEGEDEDEDEHGGGTTSRDHDSYLLSLSYAGGRDGMETTERLVAVLPRILAQRGCAYLLLCAQNKPERVKARIRGFGAGWRAETVASSGKTAGWEKLQVLRIWRDHGGGNGSGS
ncbi:hypothetical protein C2857_005028 [Epichloe festucae Fl1]|uniref:ERF1 methyltransferase catalytic subunit MTQ2 n=1 Tax=Epichloe festucae (strain Fl1) TaxID=877507 RepID=A0A7S9PVL2_EPIFF|nr:hypothetical protein C2857_005028 [Epichloe festucae Fl1]